MMYNMVKKVVQIYMTIIISIIIIIKNGAQGGARYKYPPAVARILESLGTPAGATAKAYTSPPTKRAPEGFLVAWVALSRRN